MGADGEVPTETLCDLTSFLSAEDRDEAVGGMSEMASQMSSDGAGREEVIAELVDFLAAEESALAMEEDRAESRRPKAAVSDPVAVLQGLPEAPGGSTFVKQQNRQGVRLTAVAALCVLLVIASTVRSLLSTSDSTFHGYSVSVPLSTSKAEKHVVRVELTDGLHLLFLEIPIVANAIEGDQTYVLHLRNEDGRTIASEPVDGARLKMAAGAVTTYTWAIQAAELVEGRYTLESPDGAELSFNIVYPKT